MTRRLPTDSADPSKADVITFRGLQSSVVHDATGAYFDTTERNGRRVHRAIPVVPDDTDVSDAPDQAVVRSVAEQLVESNPLVAWGVVCEHQTDDGTVCGDVFPSIDSVNAHQHVHSNSEPDGGETGE